MHGKVEVFHRPNVRLFFYAGGLYRYVPDSNDNTVRAYSIKQNGSPSAVSGSPFAATGAADVLSIL